LPLANDTEQDGARSSCLHIVSASHPKGSRFIAYTSRCATQR